MAFDVLILDEEGFVERRPDGAGGAAPVVAPGPRQPEGSPLRRPASNAGLSAGSGSATRRWRGALRGLAFLGVLTAAGGALAGRHAIVKAVPAVAPAYAAVGLPANVRGVEIRDVITTLSDAGGQTVLMVEGQVANPRQRRVAVAELTLILRDERGRELYRWTAPPPVSRLEAGESAPFKARLVSPLRDARDVLVRFSAAG